MKVQVHRLNNPMIVQVDGLLDEDHIDALIAEIDEHVKFKRATVVDHKTGGSEINDKRTNWTASHSLDYNKCVAARNFLFKAAQFIQLHPAQAEPLSIIKYDIGQQYEPHHDSFALETFDKHKPEAGNRICTALIYLKQPIEGGETDFPHFPHIHIEPVRGRVLFFSTSHMGTDTKLDSSLHAAKPVIKGEKLAANLWFRANTYDPRMLPKSENEEEK